MPPTYEQVVAVGQSQYLNRYTYWKRLEPRAREDNFIRSVQACLRDPLWMLTRQWQFGELKGEDAGSPVKVAFQVERSKITHCKAHVFDEPGTVKSIETDMPLETILEQEIPIIDIRLSVQIGLEFEQQLTELGIGAQIVAKYKELFSLHEPSEEERITIDDETLDFLQVVSTRVINGRKLIEAGQVFSENPVIPEEVIAIANPEEQDLIKTALSNLHAWYHSAYTHPVLNTECAWDHSSLCYACCTSAPRSADKQYVLEISDALGGELDWSHFSVFRDIEKKLDHSDDVSSSIVTDDIKEMIPTPINFTGMPNSRYWALEDAKTNFGEMDVKTTDLGKLLLMEFAFIYGDDWFHIPLPLEVGSICHVKSLKVYDVFENEFDIKRAGGMASQSWQRWDMYSISYKREKQLQDINLNRLYDSAPFLFLPPTLGGNEISANFDEVHFIRDEMANMVWGIQQKIASGLGKEMNAFDYWKNRNDKKDIRFYKNTTRQLLSLFNQEIPDVIGALIVRSRSIEGIEELSGSIVEINELTNSITDLKDGVQESESLSYLNSLYSRSLIIQQNKTELQNKIDEIEDIPTAFVLRRFYNVINASMESIHIIILSFMNAYYAISLEAHETCYEDVKTCLNKLLNVSEQSEANQKLLEISSKSTNGIPIYRLMSSVPENWIPYVPVHIQGGNRDMQLVQARLIRERNQETDFITPISRILTTAELDGKMHAINEEAVARHGINVCMHWQRTRWIDGSTHVWIARKIMPGRGEGSSGLRFDYLEE